eukprot:6179051-Pleurochrysis_carterae.AAC.1
MKLQHSKGSGEQAWGKGENEDGRSALAAAQLSPGAPAPSQLLAADIVNADGLPALVMQMIRLFLADLGVFVMCAPKSKHRHKVRGVIEELQ